MMMKRNFAEHICVVVLIFFLNSGRSAPSIKEHYSVLFEEYFNKQNHDIEMTTEV